MGEQGTGRTGGRTARGLRAAAAAAAWLAALAAAGRAPAQERMVATDTWDGGGLAGWALSGTQATLTNAAGWLEIRFAPQALPACEAAVAYRAVPAGMTVTNLSFRFRGDRRPSALRLYLHSAQSGRTWYVALPLPGAAGGPAGVEYSVPVAAGAGWSAGPLAAPALIESDRAGAGLVGVYVRRHGDVAAQAYGLDDFCLAGEGAGGAPAPDADGDGLPDAWEAAHGFRADDPSDGAGDADGDGMSNYAEFRAGTDPRDAASRFVVEAGGWGPGAGGGFTVRWHSASNQTYSVWSSTNLSAGFQRIADGLPATPPVNEHADLSAAPGAARFYRVTVE